MLSPPLRPRISGLGASVLGLLPSIDHEKERSIRASYERMTVYMHGIGVA